MKKIINEVFAEDSAVQIKLKNSTISWIIETPSFTKKTTQNVSKTAKKKHFLVSQNSLLKMTILTTPCALTTNPAHPSVFTTLTPTTKFLDEVH